MQLCWFSVLAFFLSIQSPHFTMPVASSYPPVSIPEVDIWDFLFERKDRPFPDDKSKASFLSIFLSLPC